MDRRKPGTLFYLVGHAGVGKYTIAKEIASLTEARIVDNHYINNPIFGLIELYRAEPLPDEVWDRVGEVRSAILETIVTLFVAVLELHLHADGDRRSC